MKCEKGTWRSHVPFSHFGGRGGTGPPTQKKLFAAGSVFEAPAFAHVSVPVIEEFPDQGSVYGGGTSLFAIIREFPVIYAHIARIPFGCAEVFRAITCGAINAVAVKVSDGVAFCGVFRTIFHDNGIIVSAIDQR